ncbi:MAG: HlyD family efflux transporter periplasmic adaptor subunit [Gemmatimonadales bacterium]
MSDRPRLRPDLVLVEQTYRGELSFIVKDPATRKYFRFRPLEVAVMQSLDGERTVAEAAAALVEQGLKVSVTAVGRFAEKLKGMGLCERTLRESSVLLMERLRAQRRSRLSTGPFKGNILRFRWSFGDPDKLLDRTIPYLRFGFTRAFVLASLALFVAQFVILAAKWPEFVRAITDIYLLRASVWDYALFWMIGNLIIAAHELGHAYACKRYGGEVHEIGVMMLYFEMAFFCNVNDAWTFPDRKARLWVTAAGSWVQMLLGSMCAIVWYMAEPDTLVADVALAGFLVGGITAVVINLNPLIPLDGYYALCDWLEVPNLRKRAFDHLSWTIRARWLGLDLPMPPADEREQRIFLLYATLAAAYTGSIFLVICTIAYGELSRAFGAMGVALLVVAVWMSTRRARRRLRDAAADAWREIGARPRLRAGLRRAGYGIGAGAAVIALAGFVPWPITAIAPFVVASGSSGVLVAPDSGVVFEVLVREGSSVRAAAPLATIRNLELERSVARAGRAVDSLRLREAQARARGREGEATRLAAEARAEVARLGGLRDRVRSLTLRAPEDGIVESPRPDTLVGRAVSLGDTLLRLARSSQVEARIALAGAGGALARPGQRVRLISHADPGYRVEGSLTSVAASASPDGLVESRVRLAGAEALRPGMTGEARITLRESNIWGALWWAVRSRIRTDVLL